MNRATWRRAAALFSAAVLTAMALAAPATAGPSPAAASGGIGVLSAPVINWVHCDSGGSRIVCQSSISGTWTSIVWFANGTPRATNVLGLNQRCSPGSVYSIQVSNASGTVSAFGGVCRGGMWQ